MKDIPNYHRSQCKLCKSGKATNYIDWNWIDHVYCISLKDREDRRKQAELEFHKIGLCDKVLFYRPEKDTSDYKRPGTRGCWNSHHTVAKRGYDSGAKMVLIFEDDVKFDEKYITNESIQKLIQYLDKLRYWNIIYLGSWSFFSLPTQYLHLHRNYSLAAHAYLISNRALKWLARTPYEKASKLHEYKNFVGFGVDVFYMFTPKVYGYFPMMAYQRGAKSSNQRPNTLGKYLFDAALSNPNFMKYNQYVTFILSISSITAVLYGVMTPFM